MTTNLPPEHDILLARRDPHFTDFGKVIFDSRCRRCWYDQALQDVQPLVEAARDMAERAERCQRILRERDDVRHDSPQGWNVLDTGEASSDPRDSCNPRPRHGG